jgi:gas vesicle protein
MRRVVSFINGLMLGGLIGLTVGLLLAPSPGEEVRNQIKERVQQVQLEARNAAAARRAELEKQLAEMRAPRQ